MSDSLEGVFVRALVLLSGGLDSILAARLLTETGFEVTGIDVAAPEAELPFECIAVDRAHIYEEDPKQREANRELAYIWLDLAERLGAEALRIDNGLMMGVATRRDHDITGSIGYAARRYTGIIDMQEEGLHVVDGQQIMLAAREIKNWDEIQLLTQAASMVDGVYHMIYEELKPGVRENDIVALSNKMLYEMGSDDVEAINAISGERCNPHPHNFTDRLIRPGDYLEFFAEIDLLGALSACPGGDCSAGHSSGWWTRSCHICTLACPPPRPRGPRPVGSAAYC